MSNALLRRSFLLCLTGAMMFGNQSCEAALPTPGGTDPIRWHTNLREALAEAERTQRPMLLKFTAPWCGYCQKLKKVAFTDKRIISQVQGHFVAVLVDADQNEKLMQALEVEGLPTMVLVSSDLEVITKIVGYQTPDQLHQKFSSVIETQVKRPRLTGVPPIRN